MLNDLPDTLNGTYERILKSIPNMHEQSTKRLLQFLVFSERPLDLDEALDVVAVEIEEDHFDEGNRLPRPKEISQYCSSLVIIAPGKHGKDSIQLAHFTVKEYLISSNLMVNIIEGLKPVAARTSIAKVCLKYLLQLGHSRVTENIKEKFFFARFAAKYWMRHAAIAEKHDEEVCALATEFFSCRRAYEACLQLYNPDIVWYKTRHPEPPPALYYASFGGLSRIAQMLIERGEDINAQCGPYNWTALYSASSRGDKEMVQMLIDKGADVNVQVKKGMTALYIASSRGYESIVQKLLTKGADVDIRTDWGITALDKASSRGFENIVQMLRQKAPFAGHQLTNTSSSFSTIDHHSTCGSSSTTNSQSSLFSTINSGGTSFSSINSDNDQEQKSPSESGVQMKVECGAKGEPTPTSAEAPRTSPQETASSSTTTHSTALSTPLGVFVSESTIGRPLGPTGENTPNATAMVPIASVPPVTSSSTRKRKSVATCHSGPQASVKPGRLGAKRRRTSSQDRGPRVHHMRLRSACTA